MDIIAKRLREIAKAGGMRRLATVGAINEEARTVELAISSETEKVERWYGIEVLGHDSNEIDLSRMNNKAPLCWMHDLRDQRGVVEPGTARVDADRIARCTVRLSSSPEGEKLFRDMIDGIVTKVSVGYTVSGMKLVEERDGTDVYRVTAWQIYEVSMVSAAADDDMGVGRGYVENPPQENEPETRETASVNTILPVNIKDNRMTPEEIAAKKAADAAADAARAAGTDAERARVAAIQKLGERFAATDMARTFIGNGGTVEAMRDALLEAQEKREKTPLNEQSKDTNIGLNDKEVRQFSIVNVCRALADPTDATAMKNAAFEFEASQAARARSGRDGDRFMIPSDVLTRAMNSTSGGATNADTGGYSIQNTLQTQSFVEILRNRAVLMQHARVLGGLVGNIDIPRQTAAAQGYWLGEDEDATETGIGLGQFSMSPKTVAAFTEVTRKLLKQSSMDVEAMLRFDLAVQLALTIDKAGFYGTGSDHQPTGLVNQFGIHAQPFAAAGQPTYKELVNMETQIAIDNADVNSMVYIANAGFRGYAKTALKFPTSSSDATIWESGATVNGYKADITNQVNAGDVFFGNFSDMLIGMWGGLELMVDPFTGSKKGRVRIITFQDVDIALRRNASFTLGR